MAARKRVACVVGTRPEAIKMAPVILMLKNEPWCDLKVIATAQHRAMLDQVLTLFGIRADHDLNLMKENQSLPELAARVIESLDKTFSILQPNIVVGQGDTTTVLATAITSFYRGIPFAHVEAGLRSGNLAHPFPEEFNRVAASIGTRLHFAPTESARANLIREHVSPDKISVTGNTVIDALLLMAATNPSLPIELDPARKLILMTVHRRESFGSALEEICKAVVRILDRNPSFDLLLPVHPNPNVKTTIERILSRHPNIHLVQPLEYHHFVAAMRRSAIILTDSGGVQEEAPALGKPVLVLRNTTERPEAISAGAALLVGTDPGTIEAETQRLIDDPLHYGSMSKGVSPYGDGKAAGRIVKLLQELQ